MGKAGNEIEQLRQEIDEIDKALVELLNKRASLSLRIGELKRNDSQSAVYVPDREIVVYSNIISANRGPLSDSALKSIYDVIIEESRRLQMSLYHRKR